MRSRATLTENRVVPAVVRAHARIDAREPRREHVLELAEREVRDEDLPDLRDDDESLARDVERVAGLDVTREDEHERDRPAPGGSSRRPVRPGSARTCDVAPRKISWPKITKPLSTFAAIFAALSRLMNWPGRRPIWS